MDPYADELALLNALRNRDEAAFTYLVEQYHAALVRVARIYVLDSAIAEEVAQETWLAVLNGLDGFEGRSSLKTWIFTILANKARTRGRREGRTLSYSELEESHPGQPTVDPARFKDPSAREWPNHWAAGAEPASWVGIPEEILLAQETIQLVRKTIDSLPENQRLVITLHDLDLISAQEICNILEISETNQRVLLHRARARVRDALEGYLKTEQEW
jgi:RNA polymerase sigma-70 factor, ECF subfamily